MLATPAFAFQCPSDIAAIDAALAASPDLSQEQIAEVTALRDEGEALHQAGDHQASVDTLAQAKEILGIE
jgi:hypothetical protein